MRSGGRFETPWLIRFDPGSILGFRNPSTHMKTDAYTKFILTVIAICLLALVLKPYDGGGLISTVHAAASSTNEPVEVRIVGIETNFPGIPVYQVETRPWRVLMSLDAPGGVPVTLPVYAPNPIPVYSRFPQQ